MEENKTFTGCLEDTRSEKEKAKDWYKDLSMAGPVKWEEKTFEDVVPLPVRNQDGSGSCVAQTLALMMGIENFLEEGKFLEFSAGDIYIRRSNEGAGMIGVEAFEIVRKNGATLEASMPSQNIGEYEINKLVRTEADVQIGKIFKIKDYKQIAFSMDSIATIMEMKTRDRVKKPLMMWFRFPRVEWNAIPQVTQTTKDWVHHSTTGRDYGLMNGVKHSFNQDSWGLHSTTMQGLRALSESYLKRMTFCGYMNDLPNDHQSTPEVTITSILRAGSKGDEVKELQRLLNITVDGDFGPNTLRAVMDFQLRHGLLPDGVVGPLTLDRLTK